jgi:hypothetical protein
MDGKQRQIFFPVHVVLVEGRRLIFFSCFLRLPRFGPDGTFVTSVSDAVAVKFEPRQQIVGPRVVLHHIKVQLPGFAHILALSK